MSTQHAAIYPSIGADRQPAVRGSGTFRRIPATWPVELEFLACCSRSNIDDAAAQRIQELADRVQWTSVVQLAKHHRVVPLLHQATTRWCSDRVPDEIHLLLRRAYLAAAALNLRLVEELHHVRRRLESGGVKAVFFKGSVLAEFAYRNLALRSCLDVDVLIRESDFDLAERLLREDGYYPAKVLTSEGGVDSRLLGITGQCPFVREGELWSLDVHTALMPPGYSYFIDFDTLHNRSIGITMSGGEVRTFRAEDLLQILCFHGVKNRWEALKHVCDVAELVRSQPRLDWDEVIRTARSIRGERVLYVGLELARDILDVKLPEEVRRRIARDSGVRELVEHMEQYLAEAHERFLDDRDRLSFHLKVQDTLLNKARYGLYVVRRRLKDM